MKILDTTFLIDFLRGKPETKKIITSSETLLTTNINMYEVITGLCLKKETSSQVLKAIELFQQISLLPLNDDATLKAASINAELIKKGEVIGDCDCLIAGIALSHGISTIVTKNEKHFKRIKGIKIETYS